MHHSIEPRGLILYLDFIVLVYLHNALFSLQMFYIVQQIGEKIVHFAIKAPNFQEMYGSTH